MSGYDQLYGLIKENIQKLIEQWKLEEAKIILDDYEKINPNDEDIYNYRASVLVGECKVKEAITILEIGVEKYPFNFDLLYNLAMFKEQIGDIEKAYEHYMKANEVLKPEYKQLVNESLQRLLELEPALQKRMLYNNDLLLIKKTIQNILFIQNVPDIRTHKIASILKYNQIQVDIMYLAVHPKQIYKGMNLPYKNIYKIKDIKEIIPFINNSNYDIVISCNEPDYLTALLTSIKKPLVHDCHDMMSLRNSNISIEQLVLEYIANSKSDGNIYVTNLVESIAKKKFELDSKPIMILDNFVLKNQMPKKYLDKLSRTDGEIHCVYEGGLININGHHRNIEKIFMKLVDINVHVHYYTSFENGYYNELAKKSRFLHYEGIKEPSELIQDMTKYDIGLAILNITDQNKFFLDTTFPNKVWEYLSAGLPVLFSDLQSFRNFVDKYKIGEIIRGEKVNKLNEQIRRISKMKINHDFLIEEGLYMENFSYQLLSFLQKVIESKKL